MLAVVVDVLLRIVLSPTIIVFFVHGVFLDIAVLASNLRQSG